MTIYLEEDDEGKYVVTCDEPGQGAAWGSRFLPGNCL